jgi:hypothetical protein
VHHALEFLQRHLWLRSSHPEGLGHPCAVETLRVVDPGVRQKQPQTDRDRHLMSSQGERDQDLAIGVLAHSPGILWANPDRMRAFLQQCGVVDDQNSIRATHELVGLGQEFGFQRRLVPGADRHKVMQLIIIGRSHPGGHRLQALALAGANQSRHIKRTHALACWVMQVVEERLKPGPKFVFPSQ